MKEKRIQIAKGDPLLNPVAQELFAMFVGGVVVSLTMTSRNKGRDVALRIKYHPSNHEQVEERIRHAQDSTSSAQA